MITDECLSTHTKANLHKLVKMSVKTNISGAYVMKTMNSAPRDEGAAAAAASCVWVAVGAAGFNYENILLTYYFLIH